MMRSLSSAVAGLRSHQTKMDVIGNNIANVNTYGFKTSRTTFADVYYQNVSGSRAGQTATSAGRNPTQIGYGASVATIDIMMNTTGAATTNRALDVYITGEGFIVSKDAAGRISYSRMGNLGFDSAGNLVDGGGHLIQGFPMKTDPASDPDNPTLIPDIPESGQAASDGLTTIYCNPSILEKLTNISISTSGAIIGMLEGDQQVTVNRTSLPSWMNPNSISIPTTSVYSGPVNLAISGFCTNEHMSEQLTGAAGNVSKIEMGTLALPADNNYTIKVDANGTVTLTRPGVAATATTSRVDAISLSGSLNVNTNQIVLRNSQDDIGLIITLNAGASPLPTDPEATGVPSGEDDKKPGTTLMTENDPETGAAWGAGTDMATQWADTGLQKMAYCSETGATTIDGKTVGQVAWVAEGDPYASKTEIFIVDPDDATKYIGYDELDPPQARRFVKLNEVDNLVQNPGRPLTLDLYYQMQTTDKGGNAVSLPEEGPQPFNATDYPYTLPGLEDLTVQLTSAPTGPFNSVIGTAEPGEETMYYIGNLALAKFQNASGLSESGTSYFMETTNSGEPVFVVPGLEGTGGLKSGYLEMSNVDISNEFTDMITTQRGFQANSRIITVSDEMLQELVNLKR